MSDGMVQLVEFLSVARARTDLDTAEGRPIVVVTVRPHPDRSWQSHNLGLAIPQAERLRDDLIDLLKTPTAFLLLAVLALASGCSAKVEVTNERPAAIEGDSAAEPPSAALEISRTTVEVDLLGRPAEPSVPKVANKEPVATTEPMSVSTDGIQVNGDGNTIEFHFHRHRRSRFPTLIYPVVRHQMVIVPGDGSAPVVFLDNAPPRVTLTDEQVARAYAEHMLRLAQREPRR